MQHARCEALDMRIPGNLQVGHILNNWGEDYSHDRIHDMQDAEHDMEDAEMSSATSDEDDATALA